MATNNFDERMDMYTRETLPWQFMMPGPASYFPGISSLDFQPAENDMWRVDNFANSKFDRQTRMNNQYPSKIQSKAPYAVYNAFDMWQHMNPGSYAETHPAKSDDVWTMI